jgi:hypothetical protein
MDRHDYCSLLLASIYIRGGDMNEEKTNRRVVSSEAKPSTSPMIVNLNERLATITKTPIPRETEKIEKLMDDYAAAVRKSQPPHIMDQFDFTKLIEVIFKEKFMFLWPPGLFIPGLADWKQYWFVPPAAGKNRYDHGFSGGNSSGGNIFDPAIGNLFAHAAARPTDPFLRSEAGIGFLFKPTAKLATYSVDATVSLIGQHKYDVNTEANAGGSLAEWAGVYVQAWEVNPVDGSTTAASGYGVATLFGQKYLNLAGGPEPTPTEVLNGTVTGNIMMEGGHTYLITVIAVTQIDNAWTMNDGKPMQPLPNDDLWTVWTWIQGNVSQVWVQPKVVYIP